MDEVLQNIFNALDVKIIRQILISHQLCSYCVYILFYISPKLI